VELKILSRMITCAPTIVKRQTAYLQQRTNNNKTMMNIKISND